MASYKEEPYCGCSKKVFSLFSCLIVFPLMGVLSYGFYLVALAFLYHVVGDTTVYSQDVTLQSLGIGFGVLLIYSLIVFGILSYVIRCCIEKTKIQTVEVDDAFV